MDKKKLIITLTLVAIFSLSAVAAASSPKGLFGFFGVQTEGHERKVLPADCEDGAILVSVQKENGGFGWECKNLTDACEIAEHGQYYFRVVDKNTGDKYYSYSVGSGMQIHEIPVGADLKLEWNLREDIVNLFDATSSEGSLVDFFPSCSQYKCSSEAGYCCPIDVLIENDYPDMFIADEEDIIVAREGTLNKGTLREEDLGTKFKYSLSPYGYTTQNLRFEVVE